MPLSHLKTRTLYAKTTDQNNNSKITVNQRGLVWVGDLSRNAEKAYSCNRMTFEVCLENHRLFGLIQIKFE